MTKIIAEWIEYMKAYRLYNPKKPQNTIAYEENSEHIKERVREEGYTTVEIEDK